MVGPTEEMSRRINTFNIGVVTKDFQLESLVETLDGLSTSQVEDWKRNSEVAARKLDVTSMLCVWKDAVDTIASDARTEIEVDAVIPVHRAEFVRLLVQWPRSSKETRQRPARLLLLTISMSLS